MKRRIHRVLCAPSQWEVLGGVEALVAPSATATPGEGLAGEELAESVAHQAGPVDQHPKPNLESAGEVLEAGYSITFVLTQTTESSGATLPSTTAQARMEPGVRGALTWMVSSGRAPEPTMAVVHSTSTCDSP